MLSKKLFTKGSLWFKKNRGNVLIFITLICLVYFIQNIFFKDQLKYGFRDGDWSSIRKFLSYGDFPLENLRNSWKAVGGYIYQIYYPGILHSIYGLDFVRLHQFSHLLKFLATLTVFPMVLVVTRNKMMAFLTTIIYAAAYPTAGALYMLATGAYFLAIIFLNFFLGVYWYVLAYNKSSIKWLVLMQALFLITFILGPERMYPLIPLIFLAEFLVIIKYRSLSVVIKSLKRLFILFLPLIIFYFVYLIWLKSGINSGMFVGGFSNNIVNNINSIITGNWHLLLNSFASFGSLFAFGDYWKYLGILNVTSLSSYLESLTQPLLIFFSITFTLLILQKEKIRFILPCIVPVLIFALFIYFVNSNWSGILPALRIHFDVNLVGMPSLFGFFILSLASLFFLMWIKSKDNLLLPLFIGPYVSFIFIFLTWIASDVQLKFMGPQRYLTIPALGSSLFLASMIVFIFTKLQLRKHGKSLSWVSLLLLFPIILINGQVAKDFFDYELEFAGMDGYEQTRMKNKFWSIAPKINIKEPSLFYFDESADYKNGYFDESTILAGIDDWIHFNHGKNLITERTNFFFMRSNLHCTEHTHLNCLQMLKNSLTVQNGIQGFLYKDIFNVNLKPEFIKLENFYAMRFINRDLVNIKEEVLGELKIND